MTDTTREAVERLARKLRTGWPIGPGDRIACDIMGEVTDLIEKSQARIAELEAEIVRLSQPAPVEPVACPRAAQTPPEDEATKFDRADWYWRTMDPDDCGDTPMDAINGAMVGNFCVCEIASSFTGPIRYGFIAPILVPDSDDYEFLHFSTQQEAIDAAKVRAALARQGGAE